jgi:hypothetical protein
MIGGFQVGPFQPAYQQGELVQQPAGGSVRWWLGKRIDEHYAALERRAPEQAAAEALAAVPEPEEREALLDAAVALLAARAPAAAPDHDLERMARGLTAEEVAAILRDARARRILREDEILLFLM